MELTRETIKEYIDKEFTFLAISDAYSVVDKIFDYIDQLKAENQELEEELVSYQSLCKRTKLILDDEKFWDNTNGDNGWHSSLHRDLSRACNKNYSDAMNKLMRDIINSLEAEKQESQKLFEKYSIMDKQKLESELAAYKEAKE